MVTSNLSTKLPTEVHLTQRQRWQAAALAFVGAVQPSPLPLTFLHKLYLKQYGWSAVYLVLGLTQVARVACAVEGVWYAFGAPLPQLRLPVTQTGDAQTGATATATANSIVAKETPIRVEAVRALEQLRQDGLLSEYEFEQQRRQILDLS
ncbi:MAG: hypothetical protein AAFY78_04655 [Cyanobacteria bacterium J06648_16]